MSGLIPRKVYTLAVLIKDSDILLGYKKRGFGEGKWNGFGGKVEKNEALLPAALREVKEECGLHLLDPTKVGKLEFEFLSNPDVMHVHVFKSNHFEGVVTESEEMLPKWFTLDKIPFTQMWPDDKYWLPLLLAGQKFRGYFLYDTEERIIKQQLEVLDHLE